MEDLAPAAQAALTAVHQSLLDTSLMTHDGKNQTLWAVTRGWCQHAQALINSMGKLNALYARHEQGKVTEFAEMKPIGSAAYYAMETQERMLCDLTKTFRIPSDLELLLERWRMQSSSLFPTFKGYPERIEVLRIHAHGLEQRRLTVEKWDKEISEGLMSSVGSETIALSICKSQLRLRQAIAVHEFSEAVMALKEDEAIDPNDDSGSTDPGLPLTFAALGFGDTCTIGEHVDNDDSTSHAQSLVPFTNPAATRSAPIDLPRAPVSIASQMSFGDSVADRLLPRDRGELVLNHGDSGVQSKLIRDARRIKNYIGETNATANKRRPELDIPPARKKQRSSMSRPPDATKSTCSTSDSEYGAEEQVERSMKYLLGPIRKQRPHRTLKVVQELMNGAAALGTSFKERDRQAGLQVSTDTSGEDAMLREKLEAVTLATAEEAEGFSAAIRDSFSNETDEGLSPIQRAEFSASLQAFLDRNVTRERRHREDEQNKGKGRQENHISSRGTQGRGTRESSKKEEDKSQRHGAMGSDRSHGKDRSRRTQTYNDGESSRPDYSDYHKQGGGREGRKGYDRDDRHSRPPRESMSGQSSSFKPPTTVQNTRSGSPSSFPRDERYCVRAESAYPASYREVRDRTSERSGSGNPTSHNGSGKQSSEHHYEGYRQRYR